MTWEWSLVGHDACCLARFGFAASPHDALLQCSGLRLGYRNAVSVTCSVSCDPERPSLRSGDPGRHRFMVGCVLRSDWLG